MVELLSYAKHKIIIRCNNCGSLLRCVPRDILGSPAEWYDGDLVRIKGSCPGCGIFYGESTLYPDPSPFEKLYFYAEILGDLKGEEKENGQTC